MSATCCTATYSPKRRRPFWLPPGESEHEPALPIRQWRIINDFACGPESWSVADYRPVIDQLAKLKFNRLHFSLWPWQPFVHYAHKGIERRTAYLWFDYHYPITDDMIGRELFGDQDEFLESRFSLSPGLRGHAGCGAATRPQSDGSCPGGAAWSASSAPT